MSYQHILFDVDEHGIALITGNNKLKKSDDLRGHRFGVNRVGTGPWIAAMLVLQHLGLDPGRDHISVVETTGGALGAYTVP